MQVKASNVPGVMTGLFIYTGATDDNPWDEIDIMEILGSDTMTLRLNYFTNGEPHPTYIPLDFDASADFHKYGVIWKEDFIEWYVDGKLVYRATENLPITPGRFMINLWCGDDSATDWMGEYSGEPASISAKNPVFY
jgi:endoglucanase